MRPGWAPRKRRPDWILIKAYAIHSSTHIAFGLRWLCDVDLPELPKVKDAAPPDVQFQVKSWPSTLSESADSVLWYQSPSPPRDALLKVFRLSQGELFLVRYIDGTDFLIHRSGSLVWCRWDQKVSFDYVRPYLYGPIVGFLLRLRGLVCLHASVVGVKGLALAFCASPAGAALVHSRRGHGGGRIPHVLSDDILTLIELDGAFRAVPAYPRVRLWPESVYALWGSTESLPRISEGWDKRHFALPADRIRNAPSTPRCNLPPRRTR